MYISKTFVQPIYPDKTHDVDRIYNHFKNFPNQSFSVFIVAVINETGKIYIEMYTYDKNEEWIKRNIQEGLTALEYKDFSISISNQL